MTRTIEEIESSLRYTLNFNRHEVTCADCGDHVLAKDEEFCDHCWRVKEPLEEALVRLERLSAKSTLAGREYLGATQRLIDAVGGLISTSGPVCAYSEPQTCDCGELAYEDYGYCYPHLIQEARG